MEQMLRQDTLLRIREYILQTYQSQESLVVSYPSLLFEALASQIYYVTVPPGADNEFIRLRNDVSFLAPPALYGINATEAFIDTNILMFHDYPFGPLRGNNVIIGFVDTGIDYTNPVFQQADNTTRIIRIWDQTIDGIPPRGYTYGTEYTQETINVALASDNPFAIVPSYDEIGHGTFLAGVAAGDDKSGAGLFRGGAPDAMIAMVKLRPARAYLKNYYFVPEQSVAYQDNDFIAGVNYLIQMALDLQRPLVICIGIGNNEGAHDGTTITERYLNAQTVVQNVIMVAAAGNEANSGHHFAGVVMTGQRQDVEINVAEGESGFYLNVWASASDILAISIRSPIGQNIQKVPVVPNQTRTYNFSLERTVVTVTYNYPDVQTGAQNILVRFQDPTPGLWIVSIYGEEIIRGVYNMWLPRSGFVLDGTRFLRSDTLITVAIPSTGENVITIGAYDYIDQSVYVGSGRGPRSDGQIKPELIAPGVNIEGPRVGGGFTTYVGTSSAAAITASAAALLMQWAVIDGNLREMNTRIARGILIRGTIKRRGVEYPNPAEGFGRLDLRNSIANI
ncbi:S8 family peptidase [Cellulosilyticum sp. I15G10I2]|uniref:S8 family peptidase n=1 Tax=Cellulosilyticum sp. I15G10I2 TaxID=1892843 RepID=UPI00085C117F|nr:S8 family peptidase [Cellulosilyticum sp. I15G10I2]